MIFDIESAGSVAQFIEKIHSFDQPHASIHSAREKTQRKETTLYRPATTPLAMYS